MSNLLKIRDGKQNEAVPVANITLSQAVESVWLYVFAGILAPLGFGIAMMMPSVGVSGIPVSQLLQIGFTGSRLGLQYLYQGTSSAVLNQCVARVTDEQKALAGKPSETVTYDVPIHPLLQGAADQLALADNDTCTPIGDLSLGRIFTRTADYAKASAPSTAAKRRIDAETTQILRQMKATPVPHNLIPADPSDFTSTESTLSMVGPVILSVIPQLGGLVGGAAGVDLSFLDFLGYLGGAPLDMAIGLGHNIGQGDDLTEMVSVHDLTVTKSLTAAYYAYYFSLYLFTTLGGLLVPPTSVPLAGGALTVGVSPTKMVGAVLGLPLTYGLITFHNVVRSMCLREDDLTGTGLGAEANKQNPQAHAEAVAEKAKNEKKTAKKTRQRTTGTSPRTGTRPAPDSSSARPSTPPASTTGSAPAATSSATRPDRPTVGR
ncbi:hypothetical protein [Gordonia caeni]|uniref:hypothetical protein n=1 Tax=Gordonia caeni TaxID=1007097 RepID=UPI0031DA31C1